MSTDQLLARAQARVGTVLSGKYRLDAVLGTGGMASVFAATHLRNANRVAVKILHRELAIDADLRARFLREGYASNTVEHPAAVRVLDDDAAEDGSVFLVMELLEGEPLDVRWDRMGRRLPVAEVILLTWQLLDVLAAAHDKGIVHRDLKPQNLFVTQGNRLRLLDFGVARLRELSPTMTRSGALVGTPAFMAPEQALGRRREVDASSDLWAVGATAFALLSGRCVHVAETPEEILVLAATQPAHPLAAVVSGVPPAIASVIDRALAYAKADRWPSARAMQQALMRAGDEAGRAGAASNRSGPATTNAPLPMVFTPFSVGGLPSHPDRVKRRSGRDMAVLAAGATALVALGAMGASLGVRPHAPGAASSPGRFAPSAPSAPGQDLLAEPPWPATAVLTPPSSLLMVAASSDPVPAGRGPSPSPRVKAAPPPTAHASAGAPAAPAPASRSAARPSASSKRDPLAP